MSCLSDEAGHFLMTSPDLPEGEELLSMPRLYFMFSFYKNKKISCLTTADSQKQTT